MCKNMYAVCLVECNCTLSYAFLRRIKLQIVVTLAADSQRPRLVPPQMQRRYVT